MNPHGLYRPQPRTVIITAAFLVLVGGEMILSRYATGFRYETQIALREQVKNTAINSHEILASTAMDGTRQTSGVLTLSLATALGHDSKLPYETRLAVIHRARKILSLDQFHLIMVFITDSRLPAGLTTGEINALKSEALALLGQQKDYQPALVSFLRKLIDDEGQNPIVRDYALQELGSLNAENEQDSLHWNVAEGSDPDLAATALLHLLAFEREGQLSRDDKIRLASCALKLAGDPTKPETSRATALQVCGQLKFTKARALAYSIARSEAASVPFRMAAVATVGNLGCDDPGVIAYLKELAVGSQYRLRIPALAAIKSISIQ